MSTVKITIVIFHGKKITSRKNYVFDLSEETTIAEIVQFYRSTSDWQEKSDVQALQRRLIDDAVTYNSVPDDLTVGASDEYEIHVNCDTPLNRVEDVTTTSTSVSSTNESPNENLASSNIEDGVINDELTLQSFYDARQNDINKFYESLNKDTWYYNTNFYNFFSPTNDRVVVYLLTSSIMSHNVLILDTCRGRLRRSLRIIVDMAYPSFTCQKINMFQLYNAITNWSRSSMMGSIKNELVEVVWNSYITARYRFNKRKRSSSGGDADVVQRKIVKKRTFPMSKNVTEQDYTMANRELESVARSMRESKSPKEIHELFQQSTEYRYLWIQYILKHPDFENGAAEAVIDRFPRLIDNVHYIHDDYVYFMKHHKYPVCDLATKFRRYVPGIFGLALSLRLIPVVPENDQETSAGEILPLLVKHYIGAKAKDCIKDRYIIGSRDSINIYDIIRHKDEMQITAPMVAYVKQRSSVEFYVIVDQIALKVPGTFADALQSLHELQFVLNLEYDKAMAPLFVFLEYVLGLKSRECNSRFCLKHDIESFLVPR